MIQHSLISLIVISLLSLFIIFGTPGLNPDWFQFPRNYNKSDNSQNWANHNYGHNLMISAEPNSIFMTEGGDNQVFSLLYFATAERMRPDIDFFDQKGNVFPRLYGDLLNTQRDEVELIRNIRDIQLFSTGRPIYLTWQRPNLEKLNINSIRAQKKNLIQKMPSSRKAYFNNKYRLDTLGQLKTTARNMVPDSVYDLTLRSGGNLADQDFRYLGPWYFKNFGMVYRITPLRYAIVDALELLNGTGNFDRLNQEVLNLSKISMIRSQFDYYVNQLQAEGYIKREGDSITLVKPFWGSFDHISPIRQWDHYDFSYLQVENAGNWDFLTREIFANNVRILSVSVQQKLHATKKQLSFVQDEDLRNQLLSEESYWKDKLADFKKTISEYNYDNPNITYPYAVEMKQRNNLDEAIHLFVLTARANYRFSNNFLEAIELLLKKVESNSDQPKGKYKLITEARGYLKEFYWYQSIFHTMMGQSSQQDSTLQRAESLEQRIEKMENLLDKKQ